MDNFILLLWRVGGRWVKNVLCNIYIYTYTFFLLGSHMILAHGPLLQILLIGYRSAISSHQVSLFRSRVPVCDLRWRNYMADGPTNCYWSSLNTWDVSYFHIPQYPRVNTFTVREDFLSPLNYKINKSQTLL